MVSDTTEPVYLVDAYSDPVQIKIQGRASYLNCAPLNDFFQKLLKKDKRQFVIDFKECSGMDSTFLGLIAGVALELKKDSEEGSIILYNVEKRNLELIQNLGLHKILEVNPTSIRKEQESDTKKPELKELKGDITLKPGMVIKAHENLIKADSSNLNKFQDVISFLKKEERQEKERFS